MTTIDAVRKPRFEEVPQLSSLRDLVRPLDPVASVYLRGGSSDTDLRLRTMFAELIRAGAPPRTVDALRTALADRLDRAAQLVAFACGDRVVAAFELVGGAVADSAGWGAPAHVLPLVSWITAHPPYVEVVADRTGADITAVASGAVHGPTTVVVGPDDEIERNAPGGLSQPRYHRRATDSWQHNAGSVAQATTRALSRTRARLLLVAGDIRAVHLMLARLPERPLVIKRVTGGRAPDGSAAPRAAEVVHARDAYSEDIRIATTARLRSAEFGTFAEGAEATLTALAAGRVRTLFLDEHPVRGGTAWFGPELLCAARPVPAPDGSPALCGDLVDVAVRAALLTDAAVCRLDPGTLRVTDGIGALCRYP